MTEAIKLKRWHNLNTDIDGILQLKWFTDPVVMKYIGFYRKCKNFKTPKEAKNFCQRLNDGIFFGIYANSGKLIGQTTLSLFNNNQCQFGILIGEKEFWGKGIGTQVTKKIINYAFENLKVSRIFLTTASKNIAGQKAYLKAGFKITEIVNDGRMIFDQNRWISDQTVEMMIAKIPANKQKYKS